MPEDLTPNNISKEQLDVGYWFVTHKLLLKKILIIFLIVLNAGLIGFSGYGIILDVLRAGERDAQLAQLVNTGLDPSLLKANSAKPLEVSNTQVLVPQGKYDFVAKVKNNNLNYSAHFSYRFVAVDFSTAPTQGFILPKEEKFIMRLGEVSPTRPANVSLELIDIVWKRTDRHVIPDWDSYASQHLDLPITDTIYNPTVELPDGKTIGKTTFTITNSTGFGYYDVKMTVIMYRGTAIAGVNSTVFSKLRPGESKSGEVTWYEDFGAISKIVVVPEIDILNDAVYLRAQ